MTIFVFYQKSKIVQSKIMKVLALFCLLICVLTASAQTLPAPPLRVYQLLTPQDTLIMSVSPNGEQTITHTIQKGHTLYALGKYYGVSPEILYYHNPIVKTTPLSLGQQLKIPIPTRAIKRLKDSRFNARLNVPLYYLVQPGETVYRIARTYFNTTPELFSVHNPHIKNHAISPGDTVLIGWISVYGLSDVKPKYSGEFAPAMEASDRLGERYLAQSVTHRERNENGIAFWQNKNNTLVGAKLYCSHNKAPENSIIKITNPMNNRTIFARVIGRVSSAVHGYNVKVVVSPDVARVLGAIDPKFHVKIAYLK